MEESLKDEIQNSANTIYSLKKQIEENQNSNPKAVKEEQDLDLFDFENTIENESIVRNENVLQNENIIQNENVLQNDNLQKK